MRKTQREVWFTRMSHHEVFLRSLRWMKLFDLLQEEETLRRYLCSPTVWKNMFQFLTLDSYELTQTTCFFSLMLPAVILNVVWISCLICFQNYDKRFLYYISWVSWYTVLTCKLQTLQVGLWRTRGRSSLTGTAGFLKCILGYTDLGLNDFLKSSRYVVVVESTSTSWWCHA